MSEQVAEQVVQSDAPEAVVSTTMETPAEVAQGGSGNDFLSMVPEEIREHPSLAPIKDVENLARSYVNAQRLIGSDKVPIPVNPTDEDLDNIFSRLGRPESPEGYEIKADGSVVTEDVAAQYADIAHKLRLTPQQAQGVLEYYRSTVENSSGAMQQVAEEQAKETEQALRKEWGKAFEEKVNDAARVVQDFASDEILQMRLDDGTLVGNHPAFIKAFAAIADFRRTVTSEDTISESTMNRTLTPQQAQAEIDAIYADKSHAYWDRKNAVARQAAVNRVADLMGMIHE